MYIGREPLDNVKELASVAEGKMRASCPTTVGQDMKGRGERLVPREVYSSYHRGGILLPRRIRPDARYLGMLASQPP